MSINPKTVKQQPQMKVRISLFMVLSFVCFQNFAQIQVTFPANRIVFQRNQQNKATVNIAGNYFQPVDKIEARFVPIQAGQGTETAWTLIQNSPPNGLFRGSMDVLGGWYALEVRASVAGTVVTSTKVDKVGVGEVFIVAGQSNAQGNVVYSGSTKGASDDRVECINEQGVAAINEETMPFIFSQMGIGAKLLPYHDVPWIWGRLGDLLVQKLNVPVLFYGAGLGGIGSSVWQRSAAGEDLSKELPIFIAEAGIPYRVLQASLQQYCTRTGVRAILWQQGESDDNTSTSTYFSNLKFVMNKSRQDTKKSDLAWVIARSSRNPMVHQNVIDAQNQLIAQVSSTFAGPTTDDINGFYDRADGIHFIDAGLDKASVAWNTSLDNTFFANSIPMLPSPLVPVSLSCNATDNIFFMTAANGYNSYKWSNGSTNTVISGGIGNFSVRASDNVGNTFFSQQINIIDQPKKPLIFTPNALVICQGDSSTNFTNLVYGIKWSTGETKNAVVLKKAGTYFVTNTTIYGCQYVSDPITLVVNPLPTATITANGSTLFCPSDSLTLTGNDNARTYQWSNGSTSQKIITKQAGTYSLKIRDNNFCESPPVSINLSLRTSPKTSVSSENNISAICSGNSLNLTSSSDNVTYKWNTGENTKKIVVKDAGIYSLKIKDSFGCESDPSSITISIINLPKTDINASGTTTFCAGNSVTLSSISENVRYIWSTGETTKQITVKDGGTYTLKIKDDKGCESIPASVKVTTFVLPISEILSDSPTTICSGNSVTLTSSQNSANYFWSTGETARQITAKNAGNYSLKLKDINGCESGVSNITISVKDTPKTPEINQKSLYFLESVTNGSPIGDTFEWKLDDKNLNFTTPSIKAQSSGYYTVRAVSKYPLSTSLSLVCASSYSKPLSYVISPNDLGMALYPNPSTNGIFYLESKEDLVNIQLNLYNARGESLLLAFLPDLKETRSIDLHDLAKGYYILRIKSGNFVQTRKILLDY